MTDDPRSRSVISADEPVSLTPDDVEVIATIRTMLASGSDPQIGWLRTLNKLLPAEMRTPIPSDAPAEVEKSDALIDSPAAKEFFVAKFAKITAYWKTQEDKARAGQQRIQNVVSIVTPDQKGESVRHAAGDVARRLERKLDHLQYCTRRSEWVASVLQSVSSLRETIGVRATERFSFAEIFIEDLQGFRERRGREALELDEIIAAICAAEFAIEAEPKDDLEHIVGAMANILSGVTTLRDIGWESDEVRWAIDEYVGLRSVYGDILQLLGPVVGEQAPGTQANIRSRANKRKQLIAHDEWISRFFAEFWSTYWRNRYERSQPNERQKNVQLAIEIIPTVIDEDPAPIDERSLCSEVRAKIRRRWEDGQGEPPKVRVRDEHVSEALKRVVASADAGPLGIIAVKGATPKTPKYWTRRRDVEARASSMSTPPADLHASEP